MHENEINNYLAVIKVVGVGGGGNNAVNPDDFSRCSGCGIYFRKL